MKQNSQKVPDLLLEKLLLGELSPSEEKKVRYHLQTEKNGMKRLKELEKSNKQILEKYSPKKMAELINQRHKSEKAVTAPPKFQLNIPNYFKYLAPALGIALILFFILPGLEKGDDPLTTGTEITRVKGSTQLFIYRKKNSKEEKLKDKTTAKQGDIIQIGYNAGNDRYGVIFSIDGRKMVTLHYPHKRSESTKLQTGKKIFLKESYELDDAPEYEIFFFITSEKAIEPNDILKKADQLKKEHDQIYEKSKEIFQEYNIVIMTLVKE